MEYINNEYLTSTKGMMNELFIICVLLVLAEIAFIVIIFYWRNIKNNQFNRESQIDKKTVYLMIMLSALVMAITFYKPIYNKINYINDMQINGENRTHYDVYLDGVKVEYNNVCISDYKVHFVDSEKKIILSSK